MTRRPRVVLALLTATVLLLPGCSSDDDTDAQPTPTTTAGTPTPKPSGASLARFYDQELDWSACHGGFECARLRVPLDYARPKKATIRVSVVRRPADGRKRGSVVLNPGGPGGSGVQYALAAERVVPAAVREHFDVVGFDPRGVGESEPVRCLDTASLDAYIAADPTPDDDAELNRLVRLARQFAQGCDTRADELLGHVATIDAARDMDVLRAALGDRRLTYVGKSYGTYLGALYADLFPKRVRALILDGAVDPAVTGRELNRAQAVGFEVALKAFLENCVATGCPLGSTYDDALRRVEQLIRDVDRDPLPASNAPADDGREVTEALAVLGIASALYSRSQGWPALKLAFSQAVEGDGSVLLQLADNLLERRSDGTYSNQTESNMAINCVDRPEPKKLEPYEHDAAEFAEDAPHFGPLIAFGLLPCAFWPVPAVTRPARVDATGAAPILVIGTTRDPATPYAWSRSLARQLDSGVLLRFHGDGHTVWGTGQSTCIDRIGNAYLLELAVPKAGTAC